MTLARFIDAVRGKVNTLENSAGMRHGFQSFTAAYKLQPGSVSYSDYVVVRLLYEATRDAGLLEPALDDHRPAAEFRQDLAAMARGRRRFAAEAHSFRRVR
jgi:hypothetical protein